MVARASSVLMPTGLRGRNNLLIAVVTQAADESIGMVQSRCPADERAGYSGQSPNHRRGPRSYAVRVRWHFEPIPALSDAPTGIDASGRRMARPL